MPANSDTKYASVFENGDQPKHGMDTAAAMKVAVPSSLLLGGLVYYGTLKKSRCPPRATIYSSALGVTTFLGTIIYYSKKYSYAKA